MARLQADTTPSKTTEIVPSSQNVPWIPGGQRHCPVMGSQEPPFWHLQTLAQPSPYVPREQAAGRAEKMNDHPPLCSTRSKMRLQSSKLGSEMLPVAKRAPNSVIVFLYKVINIHLIFPTNFKMTPEVTKLS